MAGTTGNTYHFFASQAVLEVMQHVVQHQGKLFDQLLGLFLVEPLFDCLVLVLCDP